MAPGTVQTAGLLSAFDTCCPLGWHSDQVLPKKAGAGCLVHSGYGGARCREKLGLNFVSVEMIALMKFDCVDV